MMNDILTSNVREGVEAICITGAVGTGKTERLLDRVAGLLAAGSCPQDILVLCASPLAARAFTKRLRTRSIAGTEAVRVTTARELALDILAQEGAVLWSGRDARMLLGFEENFLLEDIKVSGIRPKRLREMLKFFSRSWTELEDNPGWLISQEEVQVHTIIKDNLALTRSYIEAEVANMAVRYLLQDAPAREAASFAHVVFDDYQCSSKASQLLGNMLACKSIAVAGDPVTSVEVFDSFPYAPGLAEFAAAYPQVVCEELAECRRSAGSAHAVRTFLASECLAAEALPFRTGADAAEGEEAGAHPGVIRELSFSYPADEFAGVAAYVRDAIAAGTDPAAVVVAVPNTAWAHGVQSALAALGVRAECLPAKQALAGDIRVLERSAAARVFTALELVADPKNAEAWRCWCGFGDYLVNSATFVALRQYAKAHGAGMTDVLEVLVGGAAGASGAAASFADAPGAQAVADAYREGKALIARFAGQCGKSLLVGLSEALAGENARRVEAELCRLCMSDGVPADASAKALVAQARKHLLAPALGLGQAVSIVPYDKLVGLSPEVLLVAGFVNGFLPCGDYFDAATLTIDKQARMRVVDTRRVCMMLGKADKQLVLSAFTRADLETASRLKLKIERIRLEQGNRVCIIAPSIYAAEVLSRASC